MASKNILLIEPGYQNKYPPLGLMKIAQYHGPRGKKDNVFFIKGEDRRVLGKPWDRIYITTLFSFEWQRISKSIAFAIEVARGHTNKIFVGGIAASLMYKRFTSQESWAGIRFIRGLLDEAPALSLMLDEFEEELYADDIAGTPIEELTPNYSILNQVDYTYPVNDAYFVYASRGCVRKCKFCGVPNLEGEQRDTPSITKVVRDIEELYGPKKDLILMDNNIVASPRFKKIIAEIRDLGFFPGAQLHRGQNSSLRSVDFNQGVDARILCKNPVFLREIATICIDPLRIAFDHLGLRKQYEQSIRYAADAGIRYLSNYMLYNFYDSPEDLFERMHINVRLNEELNIRIFSFPMRYQPIDLPHRGHLGPKWNRYYLRSFQLILQATHGIVSGEPEFFRRAFGNTYGKFEALLRQPHTMIFNRDYYELGSGREHFDDYICKFNQLSSGQKDELLDFLSRNLFDPLGRQRVDREEFIKQVDGFHSPKVRGVLKFYVPPTKDHEREIWEHQRRIRKKDSVVSEISLDKLVEDAGIFDDGDNENVNDRLDGVETDIKSSG